MNILVTGANGQLGNEMQVLSRENLQHTYFSLTYRNWIFVTSRRSVLSWQTTGWM